MKLYTYYDVNKDREFVYQVEAESILVGDKKLKEIFGIDVQKSPNIVCEVK